MGVAVGSQITEFTNSMGRLTARSPRLVDKLISAIVATTCKNVINKRIISISIPDGISVGLPYMWLVATGFSCSAYSISPDVTSSHPGYPLESHAKE